MSHCDKIFSVCSVGRPSVGRSVGLSVRCLPYLTGTSEAIAITVDAVTVAVTGMYHVLIILTLTFTEGHTDLNRENNKRSMISETVQAMSIRSAVGLHVTLSSYMLP